MVKDIYAGHNCPKIGCPQFKMYFEHLCRVVFMHIDLCGFSENETFRVNVKRVLHQAKGPCTVVANILFHTAILQLPLERTQEVGGEDIPLSFCSPATCIQKPATSEPGSSPT